MPTKKRPRKPVDADKRDSALVAVEMPEFVYDKRTGQMTLTTPAGERAVMQTRVIEDDEIEAIEPVSLKDFETALVLLDRLGIVWTADQPPFVRTKDKKSEKNLASEEFYELQKRFPGLPREIGILVFYVFMGHTAHANIVGGDRALKAKAKLVEKYVTTNAFRSEFFFKHAIKVPYLAEMDWEVVFKLSEKSVSESPRVAYGLLSLLLREPSAFGLTSQLGPRSITVAIDEISINRFIKEFQELRSRLQEARELVDSIGKEETT